MPRIDFLLGDFFCLLGALGRRNLLGSSEERSHAARVRVHIPGLKRKGSRIRSCYTLANC